MRELAHGRTGLPVLPESISAIQLSACSGAEAVAAVVAKVYAARAFGAEYIANIQQAPRRSQRPLHLSAIRA
jgi:outer membrane PBP1 activator LpoA protein